MSTPSIPPPRPGTVLAAVLDDRQRSAVVARSGLAPTARLLVEGGEVSLSREAAAKLRDGLSRFLADKDVA